MKEPLFSILIANYNNGEFIVETLDAALSQTYPNIEIVIVDDTSTDNSVEIIKKYIAENPQANINLYLNYSNYGCGRNKRKCIDASKGEFFAFLDPEDTIEPTAVEELMAIHLKNDKKYSIVYSTHYLCNSKLEVQSTSNWAGKIPVGQSNLTSTGGHISHFVVFNKFFYDKTEGTNPHYVVAEDMDLYLKMEEVAPVFFLDKPLYYYRKHDNNISWNDTKKIINAHYLLLAQEAAYRRRKKNKINISNLSFWEIKRERLLYNLLLFEHNFIKRNFLKSLGYLFRSFLYVYVDKDFYILKRIKKITKKITKNCRKR